MASDARERARDTAAMPPAATSPYVLGWAFDAVAGWLLAFAVVTATDAVLASGGLLLDGLGRWVTALVGMLYVLPLLRHRRGRRRRSPRPR